MWSVMAGKSKTKGRKLTDNLLIFHKSVLECLEENMDSFILNLARCTCVLKKQRMLQMPNKSRPIVSKAKAVS